MNYLPTLLLTAALLSSPLQAQQYTHEHLVIDAPYTRTTPPSAPVAGGFMSITNNGEQSDTLIGGEVDFAEIVEIHEMPMIDGVMKMRQLEGGLEIPPGETVALQPGGYHVMFIKLKEQMVEGDTHKATLTFAQAGDVKIELVVKDINVNMTGRMKDGEMSQGAMPDKMKDGKDGKDGQDNNLEHSAIPQKETVGDSQQEQMQQQ